MFSNYQMISNQSNISFYLIKRFTNREKHVKELRKQFSYSSSFPNGVNGVFGNFFFCYMHIHFWFSFFIKRTIKIEVSLKSALRSKFISFNLFN